MNRIEREVGHSIEEEDVSRLKPAEEFLVRVRCGIPYRRGLTLNECSMIFGVSRERVRQIQSRAIEKIMGLVQVSCRKGEKMLRSVSFLWDMI